MNAYLQFALLSLGAGALYAALAQGLILAYRGAGVINLANGAMAMYIAYFFQALRQGRVLVPPLPNPFALVEGVAGWFGADLDLPSWPTFIDLPNEVATAPAIVLALLMACLLGLLVHLLVFGPLRNAPALAKAVGSVGLALVLQSIITLRFGIEGVSVAPILPRGVVKIFGTTVPIDRFYMLGITLLVVALLTLVFRYTRVGIATRAAAENERAAMFIGLSPSRLAGFNWVLGSLIAGGAGILFASMTGLNSTDFVLYVLPAFGAALIARFQSFVVAAAAGIGIGVLEALTFPLQADFSWFPKAGAAQGVPLVVIIVAMVVSGNKIPRRGVAMEVKFPAAPSPRRPLRTAAIMCPLAIAGAIFLPFDFRGAIVNSLAAIVLSLSFVVIVGMAGQISLMQMGIAGLAALAMTRLAGDWGLPFPIAPILAVVVAAAAGVLVGLPALRVRGVHLAVLTLGAAYAFERMVLGNQEYMRASDTSGSVPPPSIFGIDLGVNSSFPFGSEGPPSAWFAIFELAIVVGCLAAVIWLRRSSLGLRFLALRANERATTSLGVNVMHTKLYAFAVSSMLAGVYGVLSAYNFGGVEPTKFAALASVSVLALAYLGGITQVWGAVVAGFLVAGGVVSVILDRLFHIGQYQILLEGIGLVITVILHPDGIIGALQAAVAAVKARFGRDTRSQRGLATHRVRASTLATRQQAET